jgi:hypothetical protein
VRQEALVQGIMQEMNFPLPDSKVEIEDVRFGEMMDVAQDHIEWRKSTQDLQRELRNGLKGNPEWSRWHQRDMGLRVNRSGERLAQFVEKGPKRSRHIADQCKCAKRGSFNFGQMS